MERTVPRNTSNFGDELSETDSGYSSDIDGEFYEQFRRFYCGYIKTPKIFEDFHRAAAEMENALTEMSNKVEIARRKENNRKAEGSMISVLGGLMGVGGTLAAPFTFGGSLVFTAAGAGYSWIGSSISSEAETKLTEQTNMQLEKCERLKKEYNDLVLQLIPTSTLLNEVSEELQELFTDLTNGFGHLLKSVEDFKHDESSIFQAQCILKCAVNFYGVARTSTHVVKNVEKIAQLNVRITSVKQVLQSAKTAGAAVKTGVLRVAIGKPQVSTFLSKQLGTSGRQIVSAITKTKQVSQTIKLTKLTASTSGEIVKSNTVVKAGLKTMSKETTTVTKSVCKAGLALGLVFTAIDLYQWNKAMTASGEVCDAERELRSAIKSLKSSSDKIMLQVEKYKQVMKIKKFFEYLLELDDNFVFGDVEMHPEKVRHCLRRISLLEYCSS